MNIDKLNPPTYLHIYLFTYPPTHLPIIYQPTYLPTHPISTPYLFTYLPTHPPTYYLLV